MAPGSRPTGARAVAPVLIRTMAVVGAFMILFTIVAQYGRNVSQGYENQQLQAEIDRLRRENSDLRQQLAEARSVAAIERAARELGMKYDDETRVLVVKTTAPPAPPELPGTTRWRIFVKDSLEALTRTARQMPFWEHVPVIGGKAGS